MAEYIEREALLKELTVGEEYLDNDTMVAVLNTVECFPAADVVEVVHGRWISHEGYEECNICHHKAMFEHNYCPNCGAKMDGATNGH